MLRAIIEFAMEHPYLSLGIAAFVFCFFFLMDADTFLEKLVSLRNGSSRKGLSGSFQGYGGDDLPDRTTHEQDEKSKTFNDLLVRTGNAPVDGVYTKDGTNYTEMQNQIERMEGEITPGN